MFGTETVRVEKTCGTGEARFLKFLWGGFQICWVGTDKKFQPTQDSSVAYNFGCRALYNLLWRLTVSSHQVQCNIPTFWGLLEKKYVSVSCTMEEV